MTVFNDGANLTGNGVIAGGAVIRLVLAPPHFFGAGGVAPKVVQRMVLAAGGQRLSGSGLLDSFYASNALSAYDPANARAGVMQLRKARLSTEGIFGDD